MFPSTLEKNKVVLDFIDIKYYVCSAFKSEKLVIVEVFTLQQKQCIQKNS